MLEITSFYQKNRRKFCIVKCFCGKYFDVRYDHFQSRHTKSCGCLLKKHGQSKTPTFKSWCKMNYRCNNKKNINYGGRGISVCSEWSDFKIFLQDMGEKPSSEHSLDRIDVNGNYEPKNCRWATREQQMNNMRTNVWITFNGETKTVAQWARFTNQKIPTLWVRLYQLKWPIEKALGLITPQNQL